MLSIAKWANLPGAVLAKFIEPKAKSRAKPGAVISPLLTRRIWSFQSVSVVTL